TGLQDRDMVVIGNPDLAGADNLPTRPPLVETGVPPTAAQTAPFECLTSGEAVPPDDDWKDLASLPGLSEGLRWIEGIPFLVCDVWAGPGSKAGQPGQQRSGTYVPLFRPLTGERIVYLLYMARSDERDEVAPPVLLLDDGTPAPLLRPNSALG